MGPLDGSRARVMLVGQDGSTARGGGCAILGERKEHKL